MWDRAAGEGGRGKGPGGSLSEEFHMRAGVELLMASPSQAFVKQCVFRLAAVVFSSAESESEWNDFNVDFLIKASVTRV